VALVTNFKDRIIDLAGVQIDAVDDNAMQQFLIDGCYDVIDKLKKTNEAEIHDFVESSLVRNDAAPSLDTDGIRSIEYAERTGFPCRKVPETQRQYLDNANSIYQATSDDPVYYIFNGTAHIRPIPTAGETGYFYYIRTYDTNAAIATATSINGFPEAYYEHIVLYAAYMVLGKQLLSLIQHTGSDFLSLDTISKMMNDDKPGSGQDVWDYLVDEDSEMAQATMTAIQSASALNKQKYDYYKDRMMNIKAEYMGKFNFQAPGGQA
tara:strand:- start:3089 stop:3883 length:795 start_codon:yes stop_codon:yes gene_type:complete